MAKKLSKRRQALAELGVNKLNSYSVDEALALVKKASTAKFDESIDVAVNLGVDPRKSDQIVRGALVLPAGTGKTVKIAVFAQGDKAEEAKQNGADIVGAEELADQVKKGFLDFDVVIATPDMMRIVGQLGQVLGPRGLMPNPKVGTVTNDIAKVVAEAKAGRVQYRTDKNGIIHTTIGRASFSENDLKENLKALMDALIKAKPTSSKGMYVRRVTVSSTMGVGVKVDQSTVMA